MSNDDANAGTMSISRVGNNTILVVDSKILKALTETRINKAQIVDEIVFNSGLIREVGIRTRDFWGFLPKLKLISYLILYEANFSIFSHSIIFASVHGLDSSLSKTSYSDLAIVYLCYFYTYMPYFCK